MDSIPSIGFIGFGNMAQAMAKGLVNCASLPGERLFACAAHYDKLERNAQAIGAQPCETPQQVVDASDIVVVAVKPYQVRDVLAPVREALRSKVVVSVAAGVLFDDYEEMLAPGTHHLSTIPNTPIAVGAGVLAVEDAHSLTDEEYATVCGLFSPIALIEPVPGHLLSVASGIAGCGPAFAALFIESLGDAAVKNGLQRATAYRLAAQMIRGTGMLYLENGEHPGVMKDAVCSPGGTTIRGVAALERCGFRNAVISAVDATLQR